MIRWRIVKSITLQGLSVLLPCAIIELSAGDVLKGMENYLSTVLPGLILIVPPLLDLRGNVNGALASRLGTELHAGTLEPKLKLTPELKANVLSSLILSFLAAATIGLLPYIVSPFLGLQLIGITKLLTIAIIAGFVSGLILALLTVLAAFASYLLGWDPDNVVAPMMATIGDYITIGSISLAVLLIR